MKRLIAALYVLSLVCCRGWVSEAPPVHLNPNMDTQPKYKPFRESDFFEDKRSMRPRVDGTVARGELKDDTHLHFGMRNARGDDVDPAPLLRAARAAHAPVNTPAYRSAGSVKPLLAVALATAAFSDHGPVAFQAVSELAPGLWDSIHAGL